MILFIFTILMIALTYLTVSTTPVYEVMQDETDNRFYLLGEKE